MGNPSPTRFLVKSALFVGGNVIRLNVFLIHFSHPFISRRLKMLIASLKAFYTEEGLLWGNRISAIHEF